MQGSPEADSTTHSETQEVQWPSERLVKAINTAVQVKMKNKKKLFYKKGKRTIKAKENTHVPSGLQYRLTDGMNKHIKGLWKLQQDPYSLVGNNITTVVVP